MDQLEALQERPLGRIIGAELQCFKGRIHHPTVELAVLSLKLMGFYDLIPCFCLFGLYHQSVENLLVHLGEQNLADCPVRILRGGLGYPVQDLGFSVYLTDITNQLLLDLAVRLLVNVPNQIQEDVDDVVGDLHLSRGQKCCQQGDPPRHGMPVHVRYVFSSGCGLQLPEDSV